MNKLFEDDFGECQVLEDGDLLTVDVRKLSCPEYTMMFIRLTNKFKSDRHKRVKMVTCAPSIADGLTQERICLRTNLNITSHNIDFLRNGEEVKINEDSPIEVNFAA